MLVVKMAALALPAMTEAVVLAEAVVLVALAALAALVALVVLVALGAEAAQAGAHGLRVALAGMMALSLPPASPEAAAGGLAAALQRTLPAQTMPPQRPRLRRAAAAAAAAVVAWALQSSGPCLAGRATLPWRMQPRRQHRRQRQQPWSMRSCMGL